MNVEIVLIKREFIRFFRQKNRVFGAIGQPLVFWLLFGAGFKNAFKYTSGENEMSFLEYYFPGTIALIVLFTAIFSSFSVIEDRNEGFLKGLLVAPVPRRSLVFGKVLGAALLATLQAMIFLVFAPFVGIELDLQSILYLLPMTFLLSLELSALGFSFAWRMDSTAGFHAVMSVLLLPMWLLSGAFFPVDGGSIWLKYISMLNPMTYGVKALRGIFYGESFLLNFLLTLVFTLILLFVAVRGSGKNFSSKME